MQTALLLLIFFGCCATYIGLDIAQVRRVNVQWQGTVVRWRTRDKETIQNMADLKSHGHTWGGSLQLNFNDASTLKLGDGKGSASLWSAIIEAAGISLDDEGDEDETIISIKQFRGTLAAILAEEETPNPDWKRIASLSFSLSQAIIDGEYPRRNRPLHFGLGYPATRFTIR